MTERPQPEESGPRWAEFTAGLSNLEHRQLVLALGAGLREARKAAETADQNGPVRDAMVSLDVAIAWLSQAHQILIGRRDGTDGG